LVSKGPRRRILRTKPLYAPPMSAHAHDPSMEEPCGTEYKRCTHAPMIMPQMDISRWWRPRGPKLGGHGAGPQASKGPTQVTGDSANLDARRRQSRATGINIINKIRQLLESHNGMRKEPSANSKTCRHISTTTKLIYRATKRLI
jgi:hypothetical protein